MKASDFFKGVSVRKGSDNKCITQVFRRFIKFLGVSLGYF